MMSLDPSEQFYWKKLLQQFLWTEPGPIGLNSTQMELAFTECSMQMKIASRYDTKKGNKISDSNLDLYKESVHLSLWFDS